ncbi:MAG TPA: hypothetical protein VMU62_04565 [Acidobacteriaceae bacterium]|nr:hypothetical protein [Acidobacteriaceae bacterium]
MITVLRIASLPSKLCFMSLPGTLPLHEILTVLPHTLLMFPDQLLLALLREASLPLIPFSHLLLDLLVPIPVASPLPLLVPGALILGTLMPLLIPVLLLLDALLLLRLCAIYFLLFLVLLLLVLLLRLPLGIGRHAHSHQPRRAQDNRHNHPVQNTDFHVRPP